MAAYLPVLPQSTLKALVSTLSSSGTSLRSLLRQLSSMERTTETLDGWPVSQAVGDAVMESLAEPFSALTSAVFVLDSSNYSRAYVYTVKPGRPNSFTHVDLNIGNGGITANLGSPWGEILPGDVVLCEWFDATSGGKHSIPMLVEAIPFVNVLTLRSIFGDASFPQQVTPFSTASPYWHDLSSGKWVPTGATLVGTAVPQSAAGVIYQREEEAPADVFGNIYSVREGCSYRVEYDISGYVGTGSVRCFIGGSSDGPNPGGYYTDADAPNNARGGELITAIRGSTGGLNIGFENYGGIGSPTFTGTITDFSLRPENDDASFSFSLRLLFRPDSTIRPAVVSISPVSGDAAGGESVTIFGANLDDAAQTVEFDHGEAGVVLATNLSANSSGTVMSCDTPAHAAGAVKVAVVEGIYGESEELDFTYT